MKISEIVVQENLLAKGLGVAKNLISKAGSKAVPKTAAGDSADAAIRAQQDARLAAFGRRGLGIDPKVGDTVKINFQGMRSGHHAHSQGGSFSSNSVGSRINNANGKIVSMDNARGTITVDVQMTGGVKEPVYYKGQIMSWKEVPPSIERVTVPYNEFVTLIR